MRDTFWAQGKYFLAAVVCWTARHEALLSVMQATSSRRNRLYQSFSDLNSPKLLLDVADLKPKER